MRQSDYLATHTSLSPIRREFAPGFVNYKKGVLDSQPQVIKITSCLPMVGGSLWALRLLPPLKLVDMIQLKVALSTINQIKSLLAVTLYQGNTERIHMYFEWFSRHVVKQLLISCLLQLISLKLLIFFLAFKCVIRDSLVLITFAVYVYAWVEYGFEVIYL